MTKKEIVNKKFKIVGKIIVLLMIVLITYTIYLVLDDKNVINKSEGNISYNFIDDLNRNDIKSFCNAKGYEDGWFACSIDSGFTCEKTGYGGYRKYDCFKLSELIKYKLR